MPGRANRHVLICTTFLSAAVLLPERARAFPTGVFLEIDPHNTTDIAFLTTYATTLFGPATGTGCATGVSPCKGGITGIFLKVAWKHFDTVVPNAGVNEIQHDANRDISSFLMALGTLESSCGCTLQLSFGLAAGDSTSFQALDVYALSNGNTSTTLALPIDLACSSGGTYGTFNTLHIGSGGNFPIQCVLDGPNISCISQPRIWGTDSNSVTANIWYQEAYVAAVEALALEISTAHSITIAKLSGINASDLEIGIDGVPGVTQTLSGTGWCGYSMSANAEKIWTDQAVIGGGTATDVYDTGIMESTWVSLTSALVGTLSGSPYNVTNFVLDLYDDKNLPPVYPPHCTDLSSNSSNWCSYNDSVDIDLLTTGEDEYMTKLVIANTGLSWANLGLDIASLGYNKPDYTDPNYSTNEVPCAMQSVYHSPIGLQSLSGQAPGTMSTSVSQADFLAGISNAGNYGAEFIEVSPLELSAYITYVSIPATVERALSSTFYNLQTALDYNNANNATSTTCHAPSGGGSFTTYY